MNTETKKRTPIFRVHVAFKIILIAGILLSLMFGIYLSMPDVIGNGKGPFVMVAMGIAIWLITAIQRHPFTRKKGIFNTLSAFYASKIGVSVAVAYLLSAFSVGIIAPFHPHTAYMQALYFGVGLVFWFGMRAYIIPHAKKAYIPFAILTFILLLAARLMPPRGGAYNWLFDGRLQVTELVKIAFLLIVSTFTWNEYSDYSAKRHEHELAEAAALKKTKKRNLIVAASMVAVFLGQLLLAKELGTLIIIALMSALLVMYLSRKATTFFIMLGIAFAGLMIVLNFGHVETRLETWQISFDDPNLPDLFRNAGYQRLLSLCAYAVAGLDGIGYANPQSIMKTVPASMSDFMFGTVIETFGYFVGIIIVAILLFMAILSAKNIEKLKNCGQKLAVLLAALYIILHTLIPACSATDILPLVGLGIPFISMGGTAMITNFMLIAFLSEPVEEKDSLKIFAGIKLGARRTKNLEEE